MSKENLSLTAIKQKFLFELEKAQKYNVILFVCLVVILYGVLLVRIQMLRSAEPSSESVAAQVKEAKVPHIDQKLVNKLESLHDNSVSVQSLFDQARSNPFKE